MPMFRTQPSSSLTGSMRSILQSGNLGPLGEIQAGMVASRMQHESALAEKARLENEQLRAAASMREDPNVAAEYASNVAGMDVPSGTRLAGALRGQLEQPAPADYEDAQLTGQGAEPYRMQPPVLQPGQQGRFQTALAALIGNQLATGKSNVAQIANAGSTLNKEGLVTQAANTPDIPAANQITAAVHGHLRYPYSTPNASGMYAQRETGDTYETPLTAEMRRLRGSQADLAAYRATQVKAGKPATPVAPERVQRMIDMSTKDEHTMLVKQWEAIQPLSKRKATPRPTVADARANVERRYRGNGTPEEPGIEGGVANAQSYLERGADPETVAARFKDYYGQDLDEFLDLTAY